MAALIKTFMSYSHRAHLVNIRFNCASQRITMQVEFQTHHISCMKVKALIVEERDPETWDTCVDSAEAENLEPPSYSELPLPVDTDIPCCPVSEEMSFS